MNKSEALGFLKLATNNPEADFRPDQWEAVDSVANDREKVLVVQRTGWGKSMVYFLATKAIRDAGRGPTIIISPLLALMRNQIEAANRIGISATSIDSTNPDDWGRITAEILQNRYDAIFISPERLSKDTFIENVLIPIAETVGLLVIDEAHCISIWGHDFRPDYRRIVNILRRMPSNMPVLCTTATANDNVIENIVDQIGNISVIRGPLRRESLKLQTIRLKDQASRLAWLADIIPSLPGTGIVYALTKRDCDKVARWLNESGISAAAYYGGVKHPDFKDSNVYRVFLEEQLRANNYKVVVATTALGMGYDKPDLHFVIHFQTPDSIIGYYQQVGRAGRAIDTAYGILLAGREDADIHDYFRRNAFPSRTNVDAILTELEASDELSLNELQGRINLTYHQINHVLKYLRAESPSAVIQVGSKWRRTTNPYVMDEARIARINELRIAEWQEINKYVDETDNCLMNVLGNSLNDPENDNCGRCANCDSENTLPTSISTESGRAAAYFLLHAEMQLHLKKQTAPNSFPAYEIGYRIPIPQRGQVGRILSRWGDAGWGRIVQQDKHANHFRDELVDAMAELILERWQPDPKPQWVTCVPSQQHPELVPDYARRLAAKLNIPFLNLIEKIRGNEAQKLQQNQFFRCNNLDGAFQVNDGVLNTPVLLVDDLVDSSWTLTVLSILLLRAGSGPVYPIALGSTAEN